MWPNSWMGEARFNVAKGSKLVRPVVAIPPIPPYQRDTLATVAATLGEEAPKALLVHKKGVTVGADGYI